MKKIPGIVSLIIIISLLFSVLSVPTVLSQQSQDNFPGLFVAQNNIKQATIWYVNPFDGKRYSIKSTGVLAYLAIKLPNKNALDTATPGRIYVTSSPKKYWYIHPESKIKYEFTNGNSAAKIMRPVSKKLSKEELKAITIGKIQKKLKAFASEKQFDQYIQTLSANKQKNNAKKALNSMNDTEAVEEMAPAVAAPEASPAESITNVQETGVDEGGIVKSYKNFLIVLRRGRLFSVKTSEGSDSTLTPISTVNSFPDGTPLSNWYDEMLISGNQIIIIGYSYKMHGTEIGIFNIDDSGIITHNSTYFLDSDDYYSSRNFASRLVGNTLIFYMPYYLWNYIDYPDGREGKPVAALPTMKKWVSGTQTVNEESILSKIDIYRAPQEDSYPTTLHTVVKCQLGEVMDCSATAILGAHSRNFYVSPTAVYLWVTNYGNEAEIYKMGLQDSNVTMARANGSPIDQFSFKESNGYLNVLVQSEGYGEAMWNSETIRNDIALVRTPLSVFTNETTQIAQDAYTPLPQISGYGLQNRYVGDYLLYGAGGSWYESNPAETLYIKRTTTPDLAQAIVLPHSVDRIEQMGNNAVIVGSSGNDLKFTSIDLLESASAISDTYVLANAAQGELRSHGFFYKPQANGTGLLGLPVRTQGDAVDSHFDASADVKFLKVSEALKFTDVGSLESKNNTALNDGCQVSCIDWYGNSRPIFLSGRIFALLGYELVEGLLGTDNIITEIRRTDFAPRTSIPVR